MTNIAVLIAIVLSVIIFQVIGRSPAHAEARNTVTIPWKHSYVRRIFTDSLGRSLTYYLYIPSDYNPYQKYPLLLLLHGDGEKSNPRRTAAQNQATLLKQAYVRVWTSVYTGADNPDIQQRWPCFVVVPQISVSQQWINVTLTKGFYSQGFYVQKKQPNIELLLTMQLLAVLQREYRGIDADRRYITGISSGAYGVWDAIERWPNYFAAAAPVAGAGDPSHAWLLRRLPVWVFHGSKDTVVAVAGSRNMVAAMRATGGKPLYTEFPHLNHGVWSDVYSLPGAPQRVPDFFPWLFAQRR